MYHYDHKLLSLTFKLQVKDMCITVSYIHTSIAILMIPLIIFEIILKEDCCLILSQIIIHHYGAYGAETNKQTNKQTNTSLCMELEGM